MYFVQVVLQLLAGHLGIGQVNQQQVVVGAAGNQLHAAGGQLVGHSSGVLHNLAGIILELRLQCLAKADSLCSNHMLQRAALGAGEDGGVDALDQVSVVGQDQAAAGTAQGLVGGGGHNISIGHRVLVHAAGNQAGNVSHVHHQHCAVTVGDLGQLFKIDSARVSGSTGNQQLGANLGNLLGQGIVINAAVLGRNAVGNKVVVLAAHVGGGTMRQMAALGKIHAHDGIAQVEQGKVNGQVGLCAGMGLHVGIFGTKQLAGTVNCNLLNLVHKLAAAVIAVAGVALGIFVGQHAAHGSHNGRGNNVFAGNQLNVCLLAAQLTLHGRTQLRVIPRNKTNGVHHVLVHNTYSFQCYPYILKTGSRPGKTKLS